LITVVGIGIGIGGGNRNEVDLQSRLPEGDLNDAPARVVEVVGALLGIGGFE